MLLRLTDKSKEPDAVSTAEKIIGVWSTFPLSLMCVAGKIDNDGLSLSECFAYGSRQRENLLNSTWYYATEEYDLASLWALSDLSLSALTVLQIVALLDIEGIPDRLFQQSIRLSSGQEFSLEAVNESKTSLWKLALIRRDTATSRLSMHHIIQQTVLGGVRTSKEHLGDIYHTTASLVSSDLPNVLTEEVNFSTMDTVTQQIRCDELVSHVERLMDTYLEQDKANRERLASNHLSRL